MTTKEMQAKVLNGNWTMTPEALKARIVDLRQSGYTWTQIDQLLFPEVPDEMIRRRGGSPAYNLAKKLNAEGAFSKSVIGLYTPTQIVIKNPNFIRHDRRTAPVVVRETVNPETDRVTMADLGL